MQKIWFDTEFHERLVEVEGRKLPFTEFICAAFVNENGEVYSAVSNEFNLKAALENAWLRENVIEKLLPETEWKSRKQIREELLDFIGVADTQLRYWYTEKDAVLVQELLATRFLDIPKRIQQPFVNITHRFNLLGLALKAPNVPQKKNAHEVVSDAIWTKELDLMMDGLEVGMS